MVTMSIAISYRCVRSVEPSFSPSLSLPIFHTFGTLRVCACCYSSSISHRRRRIPLFGSTFFLCVILFHTGRHMQTDTNMCIVAYAFLLDEKKTMRPEENRIFSSTIFRDRCRIEQIISYDWTMTTDETRERCMLLELGLLVYFPSSSMIWDNLFCCSSRLFYKHMMSSPKKSTVMIQYVLHHLILVIVH